MNTWIALLRGINVGGANSLPMKALKTLLEKNGCTDVQTYIQSGNVVFRRRASSAAKLERQIAAAIAEGHGFEPRVVVLGQRELEKAAAGNPFREAEEVPTSVHLFFLASSPKNVDTAGLESVRAKSERFERKGKVLYVHAPDGFGNSKLAARAEKLLGVPATARNWRTVTTLIEMAKAY